MFIWILAVLLMVAVALAGWRQGAIRAAFAFVGILLAAVLAAPLGRLLHPLLLHVVSGPFTAWALAPVVGFIVGSIPLKVASQYVHRRAEYFYKYKAGDLRLALWARLNSRLGICIGLLNGATYFILISFFIYNLTYWTTQAAADDDIQPWPIQLVNNLGAGLQSSGFARTASAVGTLPPKFYKLANLAGLLMQNPNLGDRFASYPGLTSLWYRDDMQPLVTDATVTNALESHASLGEIARAPSVRAFLANKQLSSSMEETLESNLDDLTTYLSTGKSAKYGNEPILGGWQFNVGVSLAWLRQEQPKMAASEMRAIRALWSQAYAQTTLLLTGDNQVFIKNLPKFVTVTQPNQPPFQPEDWNGDWSRDGAAYTLHVSLNGTDKYLIGNTDGLRLKLKDGRNLLIFDHTD